MAANLCKDFLYKKGAHPSEPLDEEVFADIGENFLPEEYAEVSEKRDTVMKIMRNNLSDVLFQTVIMFYFDEMTIAEEMGCPKVTVKYRLNAARAKIKKGVLDYEKKSGDKLYAVVGVPFLALLLSKQAEAASADTRYYVRYHANRSLCSRFNSRGSEFREFRGEYGKTYRRKNVWHIKSKNHRGRLRRGNCRRRSDGGRYHREQREEKPRRLHKPYGIGA